MSEEQEPVGDEQRPFGEVLEELGTLAISEMRRRLSSGDTDGIPGSALMGVIAAYLKYREAEEEVKQEAQETGKDIIDLVLEAGLPADRKIALLDEEHQRTSDRLARIEDVRREIRARDQSERGR